MALFANDYQGGPSFDVFSAQGSNPLAQWKLSGGKAVEKVYEKDIKSYVFSCTGGPVCKMQLPKDDKRLMVLLQPYLVLQVLLPAGQPFSFELSASDMQGTRRRMFFSSAFSEMKTTPLHCQIPLTAVRRGLWLNLAIHVADLVAYNFRGCTLRSVDLLCMGAYCKLRRLFTLRAPPPDSGRYMPGCENIPRALDYPGGVESFTLVLDSERILAAEPSSFAPAIRPYSVPASLGDPTASEPGAPGAPGVNSALALRALSSTQRDYKGAMHLAFGSRAPVPSRGSAGGGGPLEGLLMPPLSPTRGTGGGSELSSPTSERLPSGGASMGDDSGERTVASPSKRRLPQPAGADDSRRVQSATGGADSLYPLGPLGAAGHAFSPRGSEGLLRAAGTVGIRPPPQGVTAAASRLPAIYGGHGVRSSAAQLAWPDLSPFVAAGGLASGQGSPPRAWPGEESSGGSFFSRAVGTGTGASQGQGLPPAAAPNILPRTSGGWASRAAAEIAAVLEGSSSASADDLPLHKHSAKLRGSVRGHRQLYVDTLEDDECTEGEALSPGGESVRPSRLLLRRWKGGDSGGAIGEEAITAPTPTAAAAASHLMPMPPTGVPPVGGLRQSHAPRLMDPPMVVELDDDAGVALGGHGAYQYASNPRALGRAAQAAAGGSGDSSSSGGPALPDLPSGPRRSDHRQDGGAMENVFRQPLGPPPLVRVASPVPRGTGVVSEDIGPLQSAPLSAFLRAPSARLLVAGPASGLGGLTPAPWQAAASGIFGSVSAHGSFALPPPGGLDLADLRRSSFGAVSLYEDQGHGRPSPAAPGGGLRESTAATEVAEDENTPAAAGGRGNTEGAWPLPDIEVGRGETRGSSPGGPWKPPPSGDSGGDDEGEGDVLIGRDLPSPARSDSTCSGRHEPHPQAQSPLASLGRTAGAGRELEATIGGAIANASTSSSGRVLVGPAQAAGAAAGGGPPQDLYIASATRWPPRLGSDFGDSAGGGEDRDSDFSSAVSTPAVGGAHPAGLGDAIKAGGRERSGEPASQAIKDLQRAFTPPVIPPSKVGESPMRTPVQPSPSSTLRMPPRGAEVQGAIMGSLGIGPVAPADSIAEPLALRSSGPVSESASDDQQLDLMYDPILNAYFDPKTNRYYELR